MIKLKVIGYYQRDLILKYINLCNPYLIKMENLTEMDSKAMILLMGLRKYVKNVPDSFLSNMNFICNMIVY